MYVVNIKWTRQKPQTKQWEHVKALFIQSSQNNKMLWLSNVGNTLPWEIHKVCKGDVGFFFSWFSAFWWAGGGEGGGYSYI